MLTNFTFLVAISICRSSVQRKLDYEDSKEESKQLQVKFPFNTQRGRGRGRGQGRERGRGRGKQQIEGPVVGQNSLELNAGEKNNTRSGRGRE